jgi:molybdopterin-binding protein
LRAIRAEGNVVRACRALKIGRDRAVYRLARLSRWAGGPVVATQRGGRTPGWTHLSDLGRRILDGGIRPVGPMAPGSPFRSGPRISGRWRAKPEPHVEVSGRLRLVVAFQAEEGERVQIEVDPEAILLSKQQVATSARNVLLGKVTRLQKGPGWQTWVWVRAGGREFRAAVTPTSVRRLALRPGGRTWLYLKATAIHRA